MDQQSYAWDWRGMRKSESDRILAGVCGGLGAHSPVPAWVWRVLFVAALFFAGLGLFLYVVLWICLPASQDVLRLHQSWNLRAMCRSRTDAMLAGVCGGLGEHSPIPAWVWRVLFLITVPMSGFGVVMYLLLWVFMPTTPGQGSQGE